MFKNYIYKKIRKSCENKNSDETLLDALHLDIPDSKAVTSAYKRKHRSYLILVQRRN